MRSNMDICVHVICDTAFYEQKHGYDFVQKQSVYLHVYSHDLKRGLRGLIRFSENT